MSETITLPWTDDMLALCSDKPLFRPCHTCPLVLAAEDAEDRAALEAGKNDPGRPWQDVAGELGLDGQP